jgi:hypothetical protein
VLPHYDEAMACVLDTLVRTSLPRPCILGHLMVLNFMDMSATKDFAITLSSSYIEDKRPPNSCHSSSKFSFLYRKFSIERSSSSECISSLSKHCSDGSTSQST